ncbi:MAG TPA: YitT family protein [Puia sp.]|nr:YitT family protein [Puia sp.]
MQYEKAHNFLINKLRKELPAYLTFHNADHTEYVIEAAEHIAQLENVNNTDLVLLKTAALFHDAGYLQGHKEHEALSCALATKYLPDFDYSAQQIESICGMIRATRMPQSPQDEPGRILCDADLYYLGTDHYADYAERLFKEFKREGLIKTHAEWHLRQVEFLKSHRYFTKTAGNEQEAGKQKNIAHIQKQIELVIHHQKNTPAMVIQDFFLMITGVLCAGVALKGFLVPNNFFDGGITGISLLIHELLFINLALAMALFNIPLIVISYFSVSHRFALRTLAGVLMLSICLQLLPEFTLTHDKLLISIFGGVFMGLGIGLVMRAGAALDGIEVLALYTLKRTSFTITEIILGINILIFSIAAFKFGIETALYSILTYFTATRCIDYVVEGIQAYTGVTIISGKSEIIKYQLVNELGRGITVYKGERGFLPGKFEISENCDIIFTVVTRLELRRLKNLVYTADPKAFVFANTIKEASGGVLKRKHAH